MSFQERRLAVSNFKECPDCKQVLDLAMFTKNKAAKDGKCRYCRACAVRRVNKSLEKSLGKVIEVNEKVCSKCKCSKPSDMFTKNCRRPDGLSPSCKNCTKEYYIRNKDAYLNRYRARRDELLAYQKNWNALNPQKKREANRKHRGKYRAMLEKVLYGNAYGRFRGVMTAKGICTSITFRELLDCTDVELFWRFECLFKEGMHEGNYGTKWEIDHIRPICSFDLTKEEDLRKCFHYTNLQPLWKEENWIKGTTYTQEE
jgi:hypothetical protein